MKETTKAIRKQIKSQLGFNSRQVSVTSPYYGKIVIEPKTEEAIAKIESLDEIAADHERIDRCEATGEILSGGNLFIFVNGPRKKPEPMVISAR